MSSMTLTRGSRSRLDVVHDLDQRITEPCGSVVVAGVDDRTPVVRLTTTEDEDVGDLGGVDVGPTVDGDGERRGAAEVAQLTDDAPAQRLSQAALSLTKSSTTGQAAVGVAQGSSDFEEVGQLDDAMSPRAVCPERRQSRDKLVVVEAANIERRLSDALSLGVRNGVIDTRRARMARRNGKAFVLTVVVLDEAVSGGALGVDGAAVTTATLLHDLARLYHYLVVVVRVDP